MKLRIQMFETDFSSVNCLCASVFGEAVISLVLDKRVLISYLK